MSTIADNIIEDIDDEMPLELMEHAEAALLETLPVKSKEKYNRVYKNFKDWQGSFEFSGKHIDRFDHGLFPRAGWKKLQANKPLGFPFDVKSNVTCQ